jgi:hypothetical protein
LSPDEHDAAGFDWKERVLSIGRARSPSYLLGLIDPRIPLMPASTALNDTKRARAVGDAARQRGLAGAGRSRDRLQQVALNH